MTALAAPIGSSTNSGSSCRDPDRFLPAIEVMYLCLSLGFMGRYRQSEGGGGEIDRLRAETHAVIAAQRTPAGQDLSRRWHGIAAPYRSSRGRLPIWVVAAAAVAVAAGCTSGHRPIEPANPMACMPKSWRRLPRICPLSRAPQSSSRCLRPRPRRSRASSTGFGAF